MKKQLTRLLSSVAILILISPFALAQTPDGETPVNEGVCDELQGGTPGLYGLCVAFCEAQDHADIFVAITEEELDVLEDAAPSGRILANYNRKKQVGDPDMPCIKVEEPCPCWNEAELAEIDGIMWDGTASNSTDLNEPDGRRCLDRAGSIPNIFAFEVQRSVIPSPLTIAQAFKFTGSGVVGCQFSRLFNGPNGGTTMNTASSTDGTLNDDQYLACRDSLRNFQATSGFCSVIEQ